MIFAAARSTWRDNQDGECGSSFELGFRLVVGFVCTTMEDGLCLMSSSH